MADFIGILEALVKLDEPAIKDALLATTFESFEFASMWIRKAPMESRS